MKDRLEHGPQEFEGHHKVQQVDGKVEEVPVESDETQSTVQHVIKTQLEREKISEITIAVILLE